MGWRLAPLAVLGAAFAAAPSGQASPARAAPSAASSARADDRTDRVDGTYRMQATVRLAPGALPARELEARGDATLEPGSGPGLVLARLAARGQRCALEARLAAGGELAFAPGQRCRVVLDDDEAKGTVDATLSSGGGRAREGLLALDLAFRVEGAVRLQPASLELLGGLSAEVPISGEARARAEGRRDESRAVGR